MLSTIAKRNKATKFLRIVADKCIHGYPDRNCPTLLIYVDGDMRQQLVGPAACAAGGSVEGKPSAVANLMTVFSHVY